MFTGIIEELGTTIDVDTLGDAIRLTVRGPLVTSDANPGDSIAVSGVCLTVVDIHADTFTADVMQETLNRSSLVAVSAGTPVNLERAVTLTTRLGGHLVQGHVDGVGRITDRRHSENWDTIRFALPSRLSRYVVEKGAIAIDGVSLTVVDVDGDSFAVGVIPTTLRATTLGQRQLGDAVNLEVDVMAKYAEKLLAGRIE
jgi:riboflavin synthase